MEQYHHHNHQVQVQEPPQFNTTTTVTTTDGSPTPVAYVSPSPAHLSSNHPSYAEMITAAILWDSSQGKAGGSSKRAIAKYIDRVYTYLPPTHAALLTHHLKRMKSTGQLVMIKNSYQLPVVAAATAASAGVGAGVAGSVPTLSVTNQNQNTDSTPKKRPGRPAKPKPEPLPQPSSTSNGHSVSGDKRSRGRPPRVQKPIVAEVPFVQAQANPEAQVHPSYDSDMGLGLNNNVSPQSSVKRRPGRPPRKETQNQGQIIPGNGTVSEKKRPGRPPKAKVDNVVGQISSNGVGQAVSSGGSKRRGRPKRNVLGPVSPSIGKKPRGRPPRQPGMATTPGKRRGRPPKGSVLPIPLPKAAMRKLLTGKPRGRPKKSASAPGKVNPAAELIKKVENMQAKIRDAVGTLKPYFSIENATNEALTALQELEDISTMDITAPPPPPPNPPVEQPMTTVPSEFVIDPAPSATTIPAPQAASPSVLPFSMSASVIPGSAPFYMPSHIGTQQPSWIPSGDGGI